MIRPNKYHLKLKLVIIVIAVLAMIQIPLQCDNVPPLIVKYNHQSAFCITILATNLDWNSALSPMTSASVLSAKLTVKLSTGLSLPNTCS